MVATSPDVIGAVGSAGWGLAGDTFHTLEAYERYGEATWFRLGDADLATHLYRTSRLREGATLIRGSADLRADLGRLDPQANSIGGLRPSVGMPGNLTSVERAVLDALSGSTLPDLVAMTRPSSGVNPIVVSTDRPSRTAASEAPAPR